MCVGKVSIIANIVTVRYAYVTIHYEGTERDDEYTLAVRVWAKSLFAHGISRTRLLWELQIRARCYHSCERKRPRID